MRRFVIVGSRATASADFLLQDLPGTSGRLDVLVRCLRAALLVSHGLRPESAAYLVLRGGPEAPRTVRIDTRSARFLRPDERSLATLVQKALASPERGEGFVTVKPGVAVAAGGLGAALDDAGGAPLYLLDEGGRDIRDQPIDPASATLVLGDHTGLGPDDRALLAERGATALCVGPLAIHAEDAIAIACNELDRRASNPGHRAV